MPADPPLPDGPLAVGARTLLDSLRPLRFPASKTVPFIPNETAMKAVREFPPNPNVLLVHVNARLTDHVVESYSPGDRAEGRPWVGELVDVPGVRALTLVAYKIRLQKEARADWHAMLPRIERILRERLGVHETDELVEEESRHRTFVWHGPPLSPRRVFEGRARASTDPLASRLFDIQGVAEVVLDGHEVRVRKCPLCSWRDLAPEVERNLGEACEG